MVSLKSVHPFDIYTYDQPWSIGYKLLSYYPKDWTHYDTSLALAEQADSAIVHS